MATAQTIAMEIRLEDGATPILQKFAIDTEKAFQKAQTASESLTAKFKSHWVELAAAATGAWITISKGWNLAEEAARYMEQMTALDNLAAKYNTTAQSIVQSIQQAANGQISQAEAAKVAAKSLMEGMNPEQLTKFMTMTTALTNATGQKIGEAFESISQALASGKTKALHQMGIIVDLNKAYDDYAAKLGVTSDHLTEHAKQIAGVDTVLKQYNATIRKLGSAPESIDDKMEKFEARLKDLKLTIGGGLIAGVMGFAGAFEWLAAGALSGAEGLAWVWIQMNKIQSMVGLTKAIREEGKRDAENWKEIIKAIGGAAEELAGRAAKDIENMNTQLNFLAGTADNVKNKTGEAKPPKDNRGGKDPLVESSAKAILEFHQNITKEITDIKKGGQDVWLGLALDYQNKEEELRIAAGARTVEDLRRMGRTNSGIKRDLNDLDLRYQAQVAAKLLEDAKKLSEARIEVAAKEMQEQLSIRSQLNQYKLQAGEITEVEGVKRKYEIERETLSLKQHTLVEQMAIEKNEANLLKLAGEYLDIAEKIKASKKGEGYETAAAQITEAKKAAEGWAAINQDSNGKYWQEETNFQLDALTLQYNEYNKYVTDKAALDKWYVNKAQEIQEKLLLGESVTAQKRALISQAEANVKGAAYKAMENQMMKLIETGKFSVGEMAQVIAQQVKIELVGMAAKAAVNAIYYTGMGFAESASGNEASAGLYFSAAGEMAAISAATLAGAAMVNAITGPSAASGNGSSYGSTGTFNQNQNNGYKYFDYQQTQYGTGWKPGEGQGPGQSLNITIHAVDAKSFQQLVKENPSAITSIVQQDVKDNGQTKKVLQRYL